MGCRQAVRQTRWNLQSSGQASEAANLRNELPALNSSKDGLINIEKKEEKKNKKRKNG